MNHRIVFESPVTGSACHLLSEPHEWLGNPVVYLNDLDMGRVYRAPVDDELEQMMSRPIRPVEEADWEFSWVIDVLGIPEIEALYEKVFEEGFDGA